MKEIIIFSGTTEGRKLSKLLSAVKVRHTVCVAGEYGKEMMEDNPYALVHVGRMDAQEIASFLEDKKSGGEVLVIDATHPYATLVTSNIKEAAEKVSCSYLRVIRESDGSPDETTYVYENMTECAKAIDKTCGNILLTTGSKELHNYCGCVSGETLQRTYVRVLPFAESLEICEKEGVKPDHIIAMQGPFGRNLNEALIEQYDIKHLITKESGAAGGFREKKEAALAKGASLHCIIRPEKEVGVSVKEAFYIATGKDLPKEPSGMKIFLVGIGMGNPGTMTPDAKEAIADSDAVFGAERLLKNINSQRKYAMYLPEDIIPVIEREKIRCAAIVFSGDTGFYSGARTMTKALNDWQKNVELKVIPGISSVSYLAARLGESYEDAFIYSLHGRNTQKQLQDLANEVRYRKKIFTLLSGAGDIVRLAGILTDMGIDAFIYAGANLSYENESIKKMTPKEALSYDRQGIVTAYIHNETAQRRPVLDVKRDADFIRDKIPMTKECVRHESIIRLSLREGDVLYDIGGGTGSVAIEAAALDSSLKVCTFEKKSEAAELIRKNVAAMAVTNVEVYEGEAFDNLLDKPKPDCVFIGGSGGMMKDIIGLLHSKGDGIRFVVNAVSLETIQEVKEILDEYSPSDEETTVLSVSEARKVGSYHMLQGENPIWIFSFTS